MADTPSDNSPPAFAPFAQPAFAVLWVATLVSNIGTWMFNVTSGWLMAELSPSALMVALVQVATSLPIFLFALPAGALGDIFDRRRDGAFQWGVFEDAERPGLFIEMFLVESWLAHLRQHARVSNSDCLLQERVNALHSGAQSPRITHALAPTARALPEPLPADHRD